MAPVVRIKPNGNQALLMFDNSRKDLEANGWLTFVQRFEGFNLFMAQQSALTFDGCRDKVGDIKLQIDEGFISSATVLPATGQRWFKNLKVEEVPWPLLFLSLKVTSCDRGMPISMLKPRWHDLLMLVKQFVTCEGRYRLVFLYHLWLLMNFIGYPLNMPFYFQHSLYKMSKRFKREKADSSLFHHGLIKLIIFYHLILHGDSWRDFVARNGFDDTNPVQVDKPVVSEIKTRNPMPFHILFPTPKPSLNPPIDLPDIETEKAETIKNLVRKNPKENLAANTKGKKNARIISRMARNKPKPLAEPKPIVLSEDSDSDIELFLADEYPYSQGLCPEPPHDFVTNLPPCLRNNPSYPGIKLPSETLSDVPKPSPILSKPLQPSCNQCDLYWNDTTLTSLYFNLKFNRWKIKLQH
jgi:hypothetical protein